MNQENVNSTPDANQNAAPAVSSTPAVTPTPEPAVQPTSTPVQETQPAPTAPAQEVAPAQPAPATTETQAPATTTEVAQPTAQPAQAAPAEQAQVTPAAPATEAPAAQPAAQPAAPQEAAPAAPATQAPATPDAQPAQVTTEAPATTATPAVATQPAPAPTTLPQPAAAPVPQPQPVPQPAQPAPTPTPVVAQPAAQPAQAAAPVAAAPAQPAVQDIQPSAPLNPLATQQETASTGVGVITPSASLNSYDNTNIGFVPVGEAIPKKKSGLKWIIILIILIGLGALGYFVIYPYVFRTYIANPKTVYDTVVKESFKKISNTVTETAHVRNIYDLQFTFDSNIESLQDYIGYTYGINVGVDPDESLIQTGIIIKDKDNVEHSYYNYVKDKKEYLRFSTYRELIYSGEVDLNKESNILLTYQNLLDISSKLDSNKINYLVTKVGDLVAGSISADKLIKEDASITINGTVTKVINNKYTVNNDRINESLEYIKNGILNDDKALDILSELTGLEKSQLKRSIEEIDTKVNLLKSDEEIIISIFTTGLKNELVGYEITDNKYDGNLHLYMKDGFFEFISHAVIKDEETGKDIENNIVAIGQKVQGKTKVNVKYNDENVANLVINTWDEKMRDVDYEIKVGETDYKGNVRFSKDINNDRGKYNFIADINVGKEFIKFEINAENTWSADVANIMIGSAKTLTDDEINQKTQEFIKNLQNTPIYKLFTTTDGNFDASILNYYDTHKVEPPEPTPEPEPEPVPEPEQPAEPSTIDKQTSISNKLEDACFKLDANGNYSDDVASCSNHVCTYIADGSKKECNVA